MINDTVQLPLQYKRALTFKEACKYIDLSPSYVYKLTSAGIIPHSKPNGKKLYFDREKLDQWLLSNITNSAERKDIQASTYVSQNPK